MDLSMKFNLEESRLKEYEALAGPDLAYRDLNTRYSDMEAEYYKDKNNELSLLQKEHQERKLKIESAWHKNTAEDAKTLLKNGVKGTKKTEAAFYQGFTLNQMETLMKNSDRGGNSFEYNNVATDLELYNRVKENGEEGEALTLLRHLKESCDTYLKTKSSSPWTSNGKIRRAMIQKIFDESSMTLETTLNNITQKRKESLAAMKDEASSKNVTEAFKAHFNTMQSVLNGNMDLSEEELKQLDSDMAEVLTHLDKEKVDEKQSDSLCSRFFNALGWSSNDPQLVSDSSLLPGGSTYQKSPLKKKMYHSQAPYKAGDEDEGIEFAKQLAGTSEKNKRLYYGIGRMGKGVYTSTRGDDPGSTDDHAKLNSWTYGTKAGSTMMTMMLNEHARIINWAILKEKANILQKMFKKTYDRIIAENGKNARNKCGGGYEDGLTMMAALFGYNTVIGKGNVPGIDYVVTSNRKALSICEVIEIKQDDKSEDDVDKMNVNFLNLKTGK